MWPWGRATTETTAATEMSAASTRLDLMKVIDGMELVGKVNTSDEILRAQIAQAIRRGHPQLRGQPLMPDRVCLIGSGPSLEATLPELVALVREGARIVTVNGAYQWALAHNLVPSCQVVMDARASNARFVEPALPKCQYLIASTCHMDVWDAVAGRPYVWIWHPVSPDDPAAEILNTYYQRQWQPVGGGTTVITRALFALRILGYVQFELFGVDSCWLDGQHHAFPQAENAADKQYTVRVAPSGHPELGREFACTGWHLAQLQDFLRIIRVNGDAFLIHVHGDGLLAYTLQVNADLADAEITEQKAGA